MLHEDGSLELYESEAEFQASLPGWAARERFGIGYRHLAGKASSRDCSPACRQPSSRGTFVPGWKTVADPEDSRQGGLGLCRSDRAPRSCKRRRRRSSCQRRAARR